LVNTALRSDVLRPASLSGPAATPELAAAPMAETLRCLGVDPNVGPRAAEIELLRQRSG